MTEPRPTTPRHEAPGPEPPPHGEPLEEDLFERAARRAREDAAGGARGRGVPPPRSRGLDPTALFVLLDSLRRVVPRELDQQLTSLIREFLLTLRSLIDWYLERLDRPAREPEVEDIPID